MAVHFFTIRPKTLIIMIIYLTLVYTTVGVFSSTYASFEVHTVDTNISIEDTRTPQEVSEQASSEPFVQWFWGRIVDLFKSVPGVDKLIVFGQIVWNVFAFLFSFITFNILLPGMPVYLSWIPFLMVIPVWSIVIIWILGLAMDIVEAVGDLIGSVIP